MNVSEYKNLVQNTIPKKHNNQPEFKEQAKLFKWADLNKHKYPVLKWIYANHNTQILTIPQRVRYRASGGKAGIPDIFLPCPRDIYNGLFIEMKSTKGKLLAIQREWIDYLNDQGYYAYVCYSAEEAIEIIIKYLERKLND